MPRIYRDPLTRAGGPPSRKAFYVYNGRMLGPVTPEPAIRVRWWAPGPVRGIPRAPPAGWRGIQGSDASRQAGQGRLDHPLRRLEALQLARHVRAVSRQVHPAV